MVRGLRMRLFLVLIAVVLASGCKGSCRRLAEELCNCATNSLDKDTCLRTAAAAESGAAPTETDEKNCAVLLPGCDCRLIATPQGKVRCGLARPALVGTPDAG